MAQALLYHLKAKLNSESFLLPMAVAWKAWELKNSEVHKLKEYLHADIVEWSREFLVCFQDAQTQKIRVGAQLLLRWFASRRRLTPSKSMSMLLS